MSADQRKHQRLPIRGFMEFTISFDLFDQRFEEIDVLSLSAGGLFVALPHDLRDKIEVGHELKYLSFFLPELSECHPDGKVVHQFPFGEIGGCGVEFVGLLPEEQRFISAYVDAKLKEFGLYSG